MSIRINGPDVVSSKLKKLAIEYWKAGGLEVTRLKSEGDPVIDATGRRKLPDGLKPWGYMIFRTEAASRPRLGGRSWITTRANFLIEVWVSRQNQGEIQKVYDVCNPIISRLNTTRLDRTRLSPAEVQEVSSVEGWMVGLIRQELFFDSRFAT